MKIIRILGKAAFAFLVITYAVCLVNGITVIEYTSSEDNGTLTVAGRAVEIHSGIADSFWKAYTRAENQAAEWLPVKLKNAVSRISDFMENGETGAASDND